MIRINLLPLAARQSQWPVSKLLLGVALLVIIIFSSIYSYSVFQVWSLEKQLQTIHNHDQALQATRVLMTAANNKQQQFDKKNNIIMVLTKERQSWYGIVQHLSAQTSPQIWFTDLIKTDKDTIQIKGWSTTYPLVADFMQKMETDQFFTEPVLNSVEEDTGTQTTKFDIVVKPRRL